MSSRTDNHILPMMKQTDDDVYHSDVNTNYFLIPNEFSDVKISFKNENDTDVLLYANKAILSEASPIIKAFLAIEPDGMLVVDEDDEQSVVTSIDVIDLLKFIYPQFTVKLTEYNITGLIHLSEKYLIDTLRNECKKFVYTWLRDVELTNIDEKKDIVPRHILYKDGTRKHISTEIGTLCAWFREYASRNEKLSTAVLDVLKHAPTDDLERNEIFMQLSDREKSTIYKMISEFLESFHLDNKANSSTMPMQSFQGLIHGKPTATPMLAAGDA